MWSNLHNESSSHHCQHSREYHTCHHSGSNLVSLPWIFKKQDDVTQDESGPQQAGPHYSQAPLHEHHLVPPGSTALLTQGLCTLTMNQRLETGEQHVKFDSQSVNTEWVSLVVTFHHLAWKRFHYNICIVFNPIGVFSQFCSTWHCHRGNLQISRSGFSM